MGDLSGQSSFRSNGCTIGGLAWAAWAVPGHGGHRSSSGCAEGKRVISVPNVPSQSPAETVSSIASVLERMHYRVPLFKGIRITDSQPLQSGRWRGQESQCGNFSPQQRTVHAFSSRSLSLEPQATWCQIGRGRGISSDRG